MVNTGDNCEELSIACDGGTSKRMLEQTSRPAIGFVDRFGMGIEKILERLLMGLEGWRYDLEFGLLSTLAD
jgi:hypothetical protein